MHSTQTFLIIFLFNYITHYFMKKNWNWDLSLIFSSPEQAQELSKKVLSDAQKFFQHYQGRIVQLDINDFRKMEKNYIQLKKDTDNIENYAYLVACIQETSVIMQSLKESLMSRCGEIKKKLFFVDLEICALDEKIYQKLCASSDCRHYWSNLRKFKPYQLSAKEESIITDYAFHARSWQRLYKEISANLIYKFKGRNLSETEMSRFLNYPSRLIRHQAGRCVNRTLQKISKDVTLIYNNLIKHRQIEDALRGYQAPVSKANLTNGISDKAVEALETEVMSKYATTSHRYYKLKAKILNCKKLSYWDRNAPYPFGDKKSFHWEEAWPMVHAVYKNFSPLLGEIADKFTSASVLDVFPRKGKDSCFYCQPMNKPFMPYILLNYTGSISNVLAYAHELGHGIHGVLAQNGVELKAELSNIEAEIASIFGEELMFDWLYQQETDDKNRFVMLAKNVENQINTVIRQTTFHLFEKAIFKAREKGEVSTEEINEIWCQIMQRSLGPYVNMSSAQYSWAYIFHFFNFPFYVYSYAASQCLVNSLYRTYKSEDIANFTEKYINLLTNPLGENYSDILRRDFNLDMEDPNVWRRGLELIEEKLNKLEELEKN